MKLKVEMDVKSFDSLDDHMLKHYLESIEGELSDAGYDISFGKYEVVEEGR